jgi:hypothetical protein
MIILEAVSFGEPKAAIKSLKVTIPENLDYSDIFNDLFKEYTRKAVLEVVKTTNLGSLFELQYTIELKDIQREKEFIDQLRCRNGNLNIACGRLTTAKNEL